MTNWYKTFAEDVAGKNAGIDPRPKRYIEARLNNIPAKKAAQMAGYTGRMARTPFKLIETPELKRQMQEAMIAKGLGLDSIAETVANTLKANVVSQLEDGAAESDVADHKTRLRGAETAAKLWGLGEANRADVAGSTITLSLSGAVAERFMQSMGPVVIEGE